MAPHLEPDPNPLTDNGQGMPPNPSHLNELHDNATIVPPPPPFPNNCATVQNIQPPTSKGQNSIALEDVSADDATEENEDNFIPPPEFLTKMKSVESLSIEDAMKELFPIGSEYPSQPYLRSLLNVFGGTRGFRISTNAGGQLACSRYGHYNRKPSTKSHAKVRNDFSIIPRQSSTLKCGCPFVVKHSKGKKQSFVEETSHMEMVVTQVQTSLWL